MGRQPSGLSQGAFLIPWLLFSFEGETDKESLFLSALCVGLLFNFISLAVTSWCDPKPAHFGLGTGLMGYLMILVLSLTQLNAIATWKRAIVWMMGGSVTGVILEMHYLAESFSLGEMFVCAELLSMLLCSGVITHRPLSDDFLTQDPASGQLLSWICIALSATLGFSVFSCLAIRQWTVDWLQSLDGLTFQKRKHQLWSLFVHVMTLYFTRWLITLFPDAVSTLVFALGSRRRRYLLLYWVAVLSGGIGMAEILKRRMQTIVMRKWFHFVSLALFLPSHLMEPILLQIALAVAQMLFFFIEALRLARIPIVSLKIDQFLASFTDHRDHGPLIISHFSLLIGLALPIWISPVWEPDPQRSQLLSLSGLISLGIGDAFAAIIGTRSVSFSLVHLIHLNDLCRFGSHHWVKGLDKSIEGSVACFLTMVLGWFFLSFWCPISLGSLIVPSLMATVFEACSAQNDNLFLPLYYLTMIKQFT